MATSLRLFIATVLTLGVVPVLSLIHSELRDIVSTAWHRWHNGDRRTDVMGDALDEIWGWAKKSV